LNSEAIIFNSQIDSSYKAQSFFGAIILVIIGTYLAFITGSIAFLKILKKNKKYYYRSKHFITVSNLSFRMMKNGFGLANICILSTMIMVTLITTIGLYLNAEKLTKQESYCDFELRAEIHGKETLEKDFRKIAQESHLKVTDTAYLMSGLDVNLKAINDHSFTTFSNKNIIPSSFTSFKLLSPFDYEKLIKKPLKLASGEVLIYQIDPKKKAYTAREISFGKKTYTIKPTIDKKKLLKTIAQRYYEMSYHSSDDAQNNYLVFFPSEKDVGDVGYELGASDPGSEYMKANKKVISFTYIMNYFGSKQQREQFEINAKKYIVKHAKQLSIQNYSAEKLTTNNLPYYVVNFLSDTRKKIYIQFGGFLFIGVICSVAFLLAITLIIYYKQLSEGEQDKARFEIMQEVGLGKDEVKKIVKSQLWIFFLGPLFFAGLNITFALPMICAMLATLFYELNIGGEIVIKIFASVFAVFVLFYLFVYLKTSKIYYRIVERKN